MSTRCMLGFYESQETDLEKHQALLYRHSDGYPQGVLPEITPFLSWWIGTPWIGIDIEYCAARLLQYLCNEHDRGFKRSWEELRGESEGYTGKLGYGIANEFHGDIEYYYAIFPDRIDVYQTAFDSRLSEWKRIESVPIPRWEARSQP